MRYWIYKCSTQGGVAGYWGDWRSMVFHQSKKTEWGGHHATRSPVSARHIEHDVAPGDVVVAYQTDERAVVGFCTITAVTGMPDQRKLILQPIERLATPFHIHRHKAGTSLATSWAVRGPVMLAELTKENMVDLLALSGAPQRILKGRAKTGGYQA